MSLRHRIKDMAGLADSGLTFRTAVPKLMVYAGSSASLLAASLLQLVAFAILARSLGVETFGALVAINAVSTIAVQFCGLGANEPLVRRVAQNQAAYPKFLGHVIILSVLSGAAVVLVLLGVFPRFLPENLTAGEAIWISFLFAFTNILLLRGIMMAEQIFIAHEDFNRANLAVFSIGVMRALSAAIACFGFGVTTLQDWAYWHVGGHVLLLVLTTLSVSRLGRPVFEIQVDEIRRGLLFAWAQLSLALRQNVDLLVLGLIAPPALVGSFGVAKRIADTSYLGVNALNRLVYPRLAVAMTDGMKDGIGLSKRVLGAAVAISIVTAIAVYIVAPVLPLLFGAEYADMVPFLRALCFIVVPFAIVTVGAEILGAAGHAGVRALMFNMTLIGSVFIGLMTYLFSVEGTIAALYAVELALAIGFWFAVRYVMNKEDRERAVVSQAETTAETVEGVTATGPGNSSNDVRGSIPS